MRTGGMANKLGNRYEGLWTAKQLLLLVHEKVRSVELEPLPSLPIADKGIDLRVTDLAGTPHLQQCKKNSSHRGWTIPHLASRGVLAALRNHLGADPHNRFLFVSNQEATALKRLVELAIQSEVKPAEFRAQLSNDGDRRGWEQFCDELGLAPAGPDGLALLARAGVSADT